MDEKITIIREIEGKISGMIQHMENFTKVLKELVPKVIEEKEIELKDGDIYRCHGAVYKGVYYLLIRSPSKQLWKLVNLQSRIQSWGNWQQEYWVKKEIEKYFTLWPDAKIVVLTFDKELP